MTVAIVSVNPWVPNAQVDLTFTSSVTLHMIYDAQLTSDNVTGRTLLVRLASYSASSFALTLSPGDLASTPTVGCDSGQFQLGECQVCDANCETCVSSAANCTSC